MGAFQTLTFIAIGRAAPYPELFGVAHALWKRSPKQPEAEAQGAKNFLVHLVSVSVSAVAVLPLNWNTAAFVRARFLAAGDSSP